MRIGSRSVDRYVLVGLFNSAADFLLFSLLAVSMGVAPVTANVISTVCVMTMSYFLNRFWVFRSTVAGIGAFVRFVAVTLFTGMLVQSAVIVALLALHDAVLPGLPAAIATPGAKLAAMATGMVINYLGYRWLFTSEQSSEQQTGQQTGQPPAPADGHRSPSAAPRSPDHR